MFVVLKKFALLLISITPAISLAAPYEPKSDAQVLERVSPRGGDASAREAQALRNAQQRAPRDPQAAVRLARRWFDDGLTLGDPRYIGHAQAVLAPWWNEPTPPLAVRVQRAKLLQYSHRFDAALVDLDAVIAADPGDPEAIATRAAIRMVRADYAGARRDCQALAPLVSKLIATGCLAYADAMSGQAEFAARQLGAALAAAPAGTGAAERSAERLVATTRSAERVWAFTRLAEIEELRGAGVAAEAAYLAAKGAAPATGPADVYLQAAHADFLLDQGRGAEALAGLMALPDAARADVLLLRLALAAKATGDARGSGWTRELLARFDAARARGDTTHEKEESRSALVLQGDAPRALALAQSNYAVQRELADARALIDAAVATRNAAAAAPVIAWVKQNRITHPALLQSVQQIEALR